MNNGTNGRDTKYSLEIINCLIKIKICQSIDIDSALCFGYFKFTLERVSAYLIWSQSLSSKIYRFLPFTPISAYFIKNDLYIL